MNLISKSLRIELLLRRNQLLSVENSQPHMAIECKEGVLWVTATGDNRDHMLYAGERYEPLENSKVVIEALKDASLDLEEI